MNTLSFRTIGVLVAAIFSVIIGATIIFGSWYNVSENEVVMKFRNGEFVSYPDTGLRFKFPLFETVVSYPITEQTTTFGTMEAYSFDQQVATMTISVNWKIDPTQALALFTRYRDLAGAEVRLIERVAPDATKAVFGRYTASRSIQERNAMVEEMRTSIMAAITEVSEGIIIPVNVTIEDIAFSEDYEAAVRARMNAEVEVGRQRQVAEQQRVQAEITVIQAQAQADAAVAEAEARAQATLLQAQAEADGIRLRGEAEAGALMARGAALRENPNLVALTIAQQWTGNLPYTMVPGGTLPILDINNLMGPTQTPPQQP